jgi:hypothetical protein
MRRNAVDFRKFQLWIETDSHKSDHNRVFFCIFMQKVDQNVLIPRVQLRGCGGARAGWKSGAVGGKRWDSMVCIAGVSRGT